MSGLEIKGLILDFKHLHTSIQFFNHERNTHLNYKTLNCSASLGFSCAISTAVGGGRRGCASLLPAAALSSRRVVEEGDDQRGEGQRRGGGSGHRASGGGEGLGVSQHPLLLLQ